MGTFELGVWSRGGGQQGVACLQVATSKFATRPAPFAVMDVFERGLCDGLMREEKILVHQQEVLVADDVRIFGGRFFVSGGSLYSDIELNNDIMQRYMSGLHDIQPRYHELSSQGAGFRSGKLNSSIDINGDVAILTSSEPFNYGAWLIRVVPKVAALKRMGVLDRVNLLCYCAHDWQRQILMAAGVNLGRVIHDDFSCSYAARRVFAPSWPNQSKWLDDLTLGALKQIADSCHNKVLSRNGNRLVYISRMGWSKRIKSASVGYRHFAQEMELIEVLEKMGFLIFEPELHPLSHVVDVMSSASMIVGPQGAGMFNAVFARPGTVVLDIEHLPNFYLGHARIFASCGLKYGMIVGGVSESDSSHLIQKPLFIDVGKVSAFVRSVVDGL